MVPEPPASGRARQLSIGQLVSSMAPVTLAVQLCSFVSSVAVAAVFGANYVTDAYYLALSIPLLTSGVMMAAVRLGAIPALTTLSGDDEHFETRSGELLLAVAVGSTVVGAVTTAGMLLALPHILGPGSPETERLAMWLIVELAPLGALSAVTGLLGGVLTVRGKARSTVAVMVYEPVIKTAVVVITGPALGGHGLAASNIVGAGLAAATLYVLCRRDGLRIVMRRPGDRFVRSVLLFSLPLLVGQSVLQLNPIIDRAMANAISTGSVTILEMAMRLFSIPVALLASTLISPLAAAWAAQFAASGWAALRTSVNEAMSGILTFVPPICALAFVLREPLVRALYQGGAYSGETAAETADVFGMFILGLPASLLVVVTSTLFVVRRNSRVPMYLAGANVILNVTLNLLLRPVLGTPGIALSTTLTLTALGLCSLYLARRIFGPLQLRRLAAPARRGALAAAVAAAGGIGLIHVLPDATNRPSALLVLAVSGIVVAAAGLVIFRSALRARLSRS